MGSASAKLADSETITDFLNAASRFGLSRKRLSVVVRAAQILSNDEFEVVTALVDFAQTGAPLKKRSAVSRGLVRAINTVREAENDPSLR